MPKNSINIIPYSFGLYNNTRFAPPVMFAGGKINIKDRRRDDQNVQYIRMERNA